MKLVKGQENWLVIIRKCELEKMKNWWGKCVYPKVDYLDNTYNKNDYVIYSSFRLKETALKECISRNVDLAWWVGKTIDNKVVPSPAFKVIKNIK